MTAPNVELRIERDDGPDLSGLLTFLQDEESRAFDDELNAERAVAIDFYNGEPFGDEEDGRSQYVTRDVAEVIDQATASIEAVMLSGDSAVEFDCQDKIQGRIITAAVGEEFYQGQDGQRVLHDWIKAGLMEKASVAKVCVEQRPAKRVELQLSSEELAGIEAQGGQIVAASEVGLDMWEAAVLMPQPPRFRDYVVPNEEMGIAVDARDLDEDCNYSVFKMPRTLSQLAEMGLDADGLESQTDPSGGDLSTARDGVVRSTAMSADHRTGPNRRVWLLEEYARYDLNGDGIAELLKVHRVGTKILDVEEMDEHPGVVWTPFPMPGRIVGQSLADKVMDIQRGRSVLFRQGLDSLYQSNSPRWLLPESSIGDNTVDDLLSPARPGGVIRHTGAVPPQPVTMPSVAATAFETAQVLAGEKEARTGITRLNQGLDPDTLNRTATGTAMMMNAGQQMEDYMVRNFAEAFARLMLKKYRLMRQWGRPMTVFVDGEEHQTDPRQWPEEIKIRVRVGLGTGRKDQRLAHRMNLLSITERALAGGLRIFTEQNIYNQVAGVIDDSALGMVSEFVTDPAKLGDAPEKPDPEMAKAEADAMMQAEKLKAQQADLEAKNMLAYQKQQSDIEIARQKLEYDLAAAREKAALEADLARDKAETEAHLAMEKIDREYQLALIRIANEREIADAQDDDEISDNRPGGALDE